MLVRSCNVSQGMRVKKVSISKSDLPRPLRALAMVPYDRPHTTSYQSSIASLQLQYVISLLGVIYHVCTSIPEYQSAHEIRSA